MAGDSDDDDDDYMSDKFLQSDNKPGLMPKIFLNKHNRTEHAKIKGSQNKTKSLKVHEVEKREEKLNTALDKSNKGFAMLAKMGFKSGMGLGKEGQGRADPIPLEIKEGRKGLGKEHEERKRKQQRIEAFVKFSKRRRIVEDQLRGDFKGRMKSKALERKVQADLYKSQKACHDLDCRKALEQVYSWAWPKVPKESESDEETELEIEEEPENSFKLEALTCYLRTTHFYCIWCGVEYNDEEDLNTNCPGDTFEAHED